MTPLSDGERERARHRVRRTLLLIVAIGVAPVVASYATYYFGHAKRRSTMARCCRRGLRRASKACEATAGRFA